MTHEATFENPHVYTRPWTLAFGFKRIPADDADAG